MKTLKPLKWAGVVIGALVVGLGAARSARPDSTILKTGSSPAIPTQSVGSAALDSVLVRACGDCHTNSMTSAWYTRVPPFSLAMARGASEGRKAVNFAEWSTYSPERRRDLLLVSCSDAKNGKMPVPAYVRVRPDAGLSPRDVEIICGASR